MTQSTEVGDWVVLKGVGIFLDPVFGYSEKSAEWQKSISVIVDCAWGYDLGLKPGVGGVDEC